MDSFRCADHRPIRIGDERERLVTASPVMKKFLAVTLLTFFANGEYKQD